MLFFKSCKANLINYQTVLQVVRFCCCCCLFFKSTLDGKVECGINVNILLFLVFVDHIVLYFEQDISCVVLSMAES